MLQNKEQILQVIGDELIGWNENTTFIEFFNTFINQKPDDPYSLDYLDYSAAQAYQSLMQFRNDYEIDQTITNDNGVFGALQVIKSANPTNFDYSNPIEVTKLINYIRVKNVLIRELTKINLTYGSKLTDENQEKLKDAIENEF